MKAVLSNRILLELSKEDALRVTETLTYKLPALHAKAKPEKIKNIIKVREGLYSIPAGREDLIPEGYEIIDKRCSCAANIPKMDITLRENQQEIVDNLEGNSIILAKVGFGKTIVSLAVANKLQLKTLIVVHNLMLRDQWCDEIKRLMNFTPSIIGSGKLEYDKSITVANVQTLTKYAQQLKDEFGLVIVDEAHKVPSTTFTNIIDNLRAKVKIGLTGTLARKDKKDMFIPDYFSTTSIFEPPRENTLVPKVYIIETNIPFSFNPNKSGAYAEEMTKLVRNPDYLRLCFYLCSLYQDKNHQVLFVADRTEVFKVLHADLPDYGVITGQTSKEERDEITRKIYSKELSGILGTLSIFKEGISINPLSCLILGTPISGKNLPMLEQLIGRVCRQYEGKKQPIILDINLKGGVAKNQALERQNYYYEMNYNIQKFTLDIGEQL